MIYPTFSVFTFSDDIPFDHTERKTACLKLGMYLTAIPRNILGLQCLKKKDKDIRLIICMLDARFVYKWRTSNAGIKCLRAKSSMKLHKL